jgi:hypothetical protein
VTRSPCGGFTGGCSVPTGAVEPAVATVVESQRRRWLFLLSVELHRLENRLDFGRSGKSVTRSPCGGFTGGCSVPRGCWFLLSSFEWDVCLRRSGRSVTNRWFTGGWRCLLLVSAELLRLGCRLGFGRKRKFSDEIALWRVHGRLFGTDRGC